MTLEDLEKLAADALPLNDDEWGSERQIDAENAFFAACEEVLPEDFDDGSEFSKFALKATTQEMVDYALEILRRKLPAAPAPAF